MADLLSTNHLNRAGTNSGYIPIMAPSMDSEGTINILKLLVKRVN
jgi:hypothetical protein